MSPTETQLQKVPTNLRPNEHDTEVQLVRDFLHQNGFQMEPQLNEYLTNIDARLVIAENALRDMQETVFTAITSIGADTAQDRAERLR